MSPQRSRCQQATQKPPGGGDHRHQQRRAAPQPLPLALPIRKPWPVATTLTSLPNLPSLPTAWHCQSLTFHTEGLLGPAAVTTCQTGTFSAPPSRQRSLESEFCCCFTTAYLQGVGFCFLRQTTGIFKVKFFFSKGKPKACLTPWVFLMLRWAGSKGQP